MMIEPLNAELQANPACVMVFNASDPSGAAGLTADITTVASVGGHPVAVVTGAYIRDTTEVFDHFCMDDEAVTDQARAALEDLPCKSSRWVSWAAPRTSAPLPS